jgi:hypothetical protein
LTSAIIDFVYAYVIAYVALDVGAVYYALKLSKITGLFRGWLLMIAALILISISGLISLVEYVLVFPVTQLEAIVSQLGIISFLASSGIGISATILMFLSMFELFRTFKKLNEKKDKARMMQMPSPLGESY